MDTLGSFHRPYGSCERRRDAHNWLDVDRETCMEVMRYHKVEAPAARFDRNCMRYLRKWLLCNWYKDPCDKVRRKRGCHTSEAGHIRVYRCALVQCSPQVVEQPHREGAFCVWMLVVQQPCVHLYSISRRIHDARNSVLPCRPSCTGEALRCLGDRLS